jgi:non-lysosomal glucosylceramidase
MATTTVPTYAWSRSFDAPEPSSSVHAQFKPYFFEALSLLPVAYRVGSYVYNERSNGREPIFDLHGITLAPPHPGPHAGAPIGGLGGGAIGRGFKGEFRRWSLHPGTSTNASLLSNLRQLWLVCNVQGAIIITSSSPMFFPFE